ncbi:hypothetical protein IH824_14940 [candidate division KSB1 bacterium]|nr:hypothetical protein [candidate division KSB1 bacterium]
MALAEWLACDIFREKDRLKGIKMLIKDKTIKIKIGLQKNLKFGKKQQIQNFLLDI